jgi:hypothetical protein
MRMGENHRIVDAKVRELLDMRGGLHHRGRVSFGGATRLIQTADTWIALALARREDEAAVPALLGCDVQSDPWAVITKEARRRAAADLVAQGRLLGMPIAQLAEVTGKPRPVGRGLPDSSALTGLIVVDLSAMWAGPLAGALLAEAGAHVIKVESPDRPDGARRGSAPFFERLNGRKHQVTYDFAHPDFRGLLEHADVVIEASRPRALQQFGIHAQELLEHHNPHVWCSITGYGRSHDWVAFGDDAAVAGGLVDYDEDGPLFYGDAIADPLSGIAAAGAIADALGTGALLDISMAGVAAAYKPN